MNRRERRYGRMYLLPLMLGLTGIALLVLEWGLMLQSLDESSALDAALRAGSFDDVFFHGGLLQSLLETIRPNFPILIFPIILMILYFLRIPPKAARIAALAALAVALLHLIVVIYCGKHAPTSFCQKIPGFGLLGHIQTFQQAKTVKNALIAGADACFVLSSVSTVFTCLIYSFVKARSDRRNQAFDQRNAYLITPAEPPEEPELPEEEAPLSLLDEPTRVLELPPEDFER